MFNCFKFTLCMLVLFCTTTLTFAQSTASYYWSDNQKISINLDRSSLIIQFNDGYDVAKYLKANTTSLKDLEIHSIQGRAVLTFNNTVQGEALEVAKTFVNNSAALKSASFGYQLNDGFQIWPTHHVVLELYKGFTMADLSSVMSEAKASFVEAKYGRILLAVEDINQVLPFANQLRESGLARWAHPDFYAKIKHHLTPSDPLYSNQFQMNNTNGSDADCNAPQAWDISRGSSSIRVAVIDDGLETHPDLPTINLSLGYSPANGGNGTPNSSGAHGVSCAGSISAAHNNIGVAGVAPNCELFSVNIFLGGETGNDLANAISYAKNNGADVLSNSWGYGSCTYSLSVLNNALADAKNNGRGGKGCVIVFAAGNDYFTCVSYPGNNPNVIGVGAITNTGVRSSYSNQGSDLDISAPSNGGTLGVYTTDRVGSAGYASGDYTGSFGGTSSACPVVAGVAALVLSVDGNLTSSAVQSILESTAKDFGSSGFDVQFGHGCVDAKAALDNALGNGGGGGGNPPTCSDNEVVLTLVLDNYASETSWSLTNASGQTVASGSGYTANGSTVTETFCLPDGCYDFTINDSYGDGICCAYGNGSYDLSSGGTSLASGGQFTSSETKNICVGSGGGGGGNPTSCPTIDLTAQTINSYGGTQDQGTFTVRASDGALILNDNAWKSIDLNYTVTANTVLEFEFGSTDEGEIHGIGFDTDNNISSNLTFKVHGTQNWGITNYDNYSNVGNWVSYTIPVGQIYTGTFNRLFFVCDDDAGTSSNAYFRNVKVYENGSCDASASLARFTDVTNIIHAAEGEFSGALKLFPNPTNNVLNVQLGATGAVQTRVTDALGRTMSEQTMQDGVNQLNVAAFPAGMYQLTIIKENGEMITEKFIKVR